MRWAASRYRPSVRTLVSAAAQALGVGFLGGHALPGAERDDALGAERLVAGDRRAHERHAVGQGGRDRSHAGVGDDGVDVREDGAVGQVVVHDDVRRHAHALVEALATGGHEGTDRLAVQRIDDGPEERALPHVGRAEAHEDGALVGSAELGRPLRRLGRWGRGSRCDAAIAGGSIRRRRVEHRRHDGVEAVVRLEDLGPRLPGVEPERRPSWR